MDFPLARMLIKDSLVTCSTDRDQEISDTPTVCPPPSMRGCISSEDCPPPLQRSPEWTCEARLACMQKQVLLGQMNRPCVEAISAAPFLLQVLIELPAVLTLTPGLFTGSRSHGRDAPLEAASGPSAHPRPDNKGQHLSAYHLDIHPQI